MITSRKEGRWTWNLWLSRGSAAARYFAGSKTPTLDSIPGRQMLLAAAREARVPLIHGAVSARYGQVATILPDDVLDFSHFYPQGAGLPETPPGILASTVTLTASLQVQEALRLLLGHPLAYHRRLAHCDGDTGLLEILSLE